MGSHITLKNATTSQQIPSIGLGTWKSAKGEVGKAVKAAIQLGYRHLDCASNYLNEDEIGDALEEVFSQGEVKREDLFLTGKLNNPYHHKEHVRPHLEKTLKDLKVDYLDLYLMHWPIAFVYVPYDGSVRGYPADYDPDGCSNVDLSANGGSKIDYSVSIQETWRAMEELVDAGLVKSIGVSNFTAALLHDLLSYARIPPVVNQVEMHPYNQQRGLCDYAQRRGLAMVAYSPLGTPGFRAANEPNLLDDEVLKSIAEKHKKSAAQVSLRWAVQRGTVVIPKSVNPKRMEENLSIYDFELDDEDMQRIQSIDKNHHYLRPYDWYQIPLFQA